MCFICWRIGNGNALEVLRGTMIALWVRFDADDAEDDMSNAVIQSKRRVPIRSSMSSSFLTLCSSRSIFCVNMVWIEFEVERLFLSVWRKCHDGKIWFICQICRLISLINCCCCVTSHSRTGGLVSSGKEILAAI